MESVEGVILTLLEVNEESALRLKNQTIWMQRCVGGCPPHPQSLCPLPTCLTFLYKSVRKIGNPHGGVSSNVFHNGNDV